MGYVTFSLGCYMVCCSIASLSVGYIYLSCFHLHSFASYDRPHVLKIKYPVTRSCQFLLDVVFCILLYERFRTLCMFTESLLYEHCLVPVRRFPSPSRSIRFGDVSETNWRGTFSHGPRDPKRFGREEK